MFGPLNVDLMAGAASAQKTPHGASLPFFSQNSCAGSAVVDMLAQDVAVLPGARDAAFGFGFPPTMVGPVLQHLRECGAHAVVLVPGTKKHWFPLLQLATVRSIQVAAVGESGVFHCPGNDGVLRSWRYPQWAWWRTKWIFGRGPEESWPSESDPGSPKFRCCVL